MPTATQNFYDTCILPEWNLLEEPITLGLLREIDPDPAHLIRFDTSRVRSLKKDQAQQVLIATTMGRAASLNERRLVMGLKRLDDPRADEIPELAEPLTLPGAPDPDDDEQDPADEDEESKARRLELHKKARSLRLQLVDLLIEEQAAAWELSIAGQLSRDQQLTLEAVQREGKADSVTTAQIDAILAKIKRDLVQRSQPQWNALVRPLMSHGAERAASMTVVHDVGIPLSKLQPGLAQFVDAEAGWLIKGVSDTTLDAVRTALKEGLAAGETIPQLAARMQGLPAFDRQRARLVARTESVRVTNGAPLRALKDTARSTGRKYTKEWSAVLDDRTRDEHVELNGWKEPIGRNFPNGLDAPGEPNCRCSLIYAVEAE